MTAATIPEGMTPVAVEKDLYGCSICLMIVAAEELCSVETCDCDFFKGKLLHDPADPVDVFCHGLILLAVHGQIGSWAAAAGREEGNVIGIPACRKNHNQNNCNQNHTR